MSDTINEKSLRLLKNDKAHAHRDNGKSSLTPSSNKPIPPEYLSVRAKEIFIDFVDRIDELHPASETDLEAIILYANNKEELEWHELTLRTEGVVYEVPSLYGVTLKARPEVAMLKQCKDLQLKILKEFGLSPSSRKNIKIAPKETKKENPFAAIGGKQKQA